MVVDDFGVKYLIKEHTLHLKEALENKYTVTKDWEGKLYIGIALKWDHEKARSNFQCQAMYVQHYTHSNKKIQLNQDSPYPWIQSIYERNNQMLSENAPFEKLDENNQKRLQKIVGRFLYCDRAVDPRILIALNSLAAVQTKTKTKAAKQVTQFLNYSAIHPDTVIEYRRSGMTLRIYLDAS